VLKGHYHEMVSLIEVIERASAKLLKRFLITPKNKSKYYEFTSNEHSTIAYPGAREMLPELLESMGIQHPMLISDNVLLTVGTVAKLDLVPHYEFFDVPKDSPIEVAEELARAYLDTGCDGIVALGGGSVLDTAKATKLLLVNPSEKLIDLIGVESVVKREKHPLIALPTTAATGSEATKVAVIKDGDEKLEFVSQFMLPDAVILDAELLITLPQKAIATGAFDALAHAFEASISGQKNPISDEYATKALLLVKANIHNAVCGQNIEALDALLRGANLAGHAFSNAMVGVVHALAHALGAVSGMPHDLAVSLLLPPGASFNGYPEAAQEFFELWLDLSKKLKLPKNLSEAGVSKQDVPQIIQIAVRDGAILTNAKNVTKKDLEQILEAAL
jgi:alcohol dehydrogenase